MWDENQPVKTRIAPSPTGEPHVGTAYIALFNMALARRLGGKFILRIEDTDRQRSTKESERSIMETLKWLGIRWDEGPDVGGPCGPYRQSERSELYRKHAWELVEKGAAYCCFCTPERLEQLRKAQKAAKAPTRYDGRCRGLSPDEVRRRIDAGEKYVIRLKMPREGKTVFHDELRGKVEYENALIDDQILLKSDGFPTYHLANVVDDHLMGVTHVMRAEEWLPSVPKHVKLYEAFGWLPPKWIHMPLLRNPDKGKSKISKRKNPVSLRYYKKRGFIPEAMLNYLALMGWSFPEEGREIFSLQEFFDNFTLDRISLGGPVFDLAKLEWMNGKYLREEPLEALLRRLRKGGFIPYPDEDETTLLGLLELTQERMTVLSDFDFLTEFWTNDILLERLVRHLAGWGGRRGLTEKLQGLKQLFEQKCRYWNRTEIGELTAGLEETEKDLVADCLGKCPVFGEEELPEKLFLRGKYLSIRLLHEAADTLKKVLPRKRSADEVRSMLISVSKTLEEECTNWKAAHVEKIIRREAEQAGWKTGEFFMPIRIACTGRSATPPLFETMEMLGKERCIARLERTASLLGSLAE